MTIDWWTLGLQTVNVLVLVWLLGRFFWKPIATMIEQRRIVAQTTLFDADMKRAEATAALADIERTRAGFAEERDAILKAAQETGERARTARLQEAAKDAASLQEVAKAAMARDRDTVEKAWADRASHLAVAIARRLAARLDGPAVRTAFLDWLLKEVRDLPDTTRQAVAASGGALEAVSATVLDPADQQHYSKLIMDAFGAGLPVTFKVDPGLIAGLELRGPHLIIANSWRADLAQILTDIAHDPI